MTLPASGQISISDINIELGLPSGNILDLNSSAARNLAGKASGIISLNDFYGKSNSVSTLTFIASSTSIDSGGSITIPVLAAENDLAILADTLTSAGTPGSTTPTDWTSLLDRAASNIRTNTSFKLLTSSDPGSIITGMAGGFGTRKVLLVFRPNSPISSVTSPTWNWQNTTGNPSAQVVSASGKATPLIVIGETWSNTGTTAFSTASPAFDGDIAAAATFRVGYKVYNSSPVDHTIDMNDIGTNTLTSGMIQVS